MAITSTIIVDTNAGTATTNIQLNGSTLIDNPVYSVSTNQVAFPGSLSAVILSVQDFLTVLTCYVTFNQTIINIFGPSQFVTTPFSQIVLVQSDDGSSQLVSEFMPGSIPLCNYTCTYPIGNVVITTRALSRTLSYPQYLFFLYLMANFKLAVLNNYHI
jgi:hypothetical protein